VGDADVAGGGGVAAGARADSVGADRDPPSEGRTAVRPYIGIEDDGTPHPALFLKGRGKS